MKIFISLLLLASLPTLAQTNKSVNFNSKILEENRKLNIYIPESYGNSEKSYPVIYSLDGEYTKSVVNGIMEYYSFWSKIPECIIVSIDQNYLDSTAQEYMRWLDCAYSWDSGLPKNKGSKFKEFISKELIPFIDDEYRTTNFRAIIGHSFTANYINYFLLDPQPSFTGYIAISPYYAPKSLDTIESIIDKIDKPIFYFTAHGQNDLSGHIQSVEDFDKIFSEIENENFNYYMFDMMKNGATHSTIFPISFPMAVEHLFSLYTPINEAEFKSLLKVENKTKYLKNRYKDINNIYGIELQIREDDINTVAYAISKKKQWNQINELARFTIDSYPNSYLGYWTLAEFFEKTNDLKAALEQYEIGFSKLGDDVLNKSDFQEDIDRIKKKLK